MHMYEFDTRVPFMMRGPGIPGGSVVSKLVGSTDLAPTFLAIAGVGKSGLPTTHAAHCPRCLPPVDPHQLYSQELGLIRICCLLSLSAHHHAGAIRCCRCGAAAATPKDMDGKSLLPLVTNSPKPTSPNKQGALPPKACTPDPCHGQGVCLTPLSPQCFCNKGFAGHRCESCAAGWTGWPKCAEVPWREEYLFEYYPILNYVANGSTARMCVRCTLHAALHYPYPPSSNAPLGVLDFSTHSLPALFCSVVLPGDD